MAYAARQAAPSDDICWIFLINAPVAALALLGVCLLVPESRDPANPRLDWPGAVLSAAGITGVVFAIIEEPATAAPRTVLSAPRRRAGWQGPVRASPGARSWAAAGR